MKIHVLGKARFKSPKMGFVNEKARLPSRVVRIPGEAPPKDLVEFELAGPRPRLFFDPKRVRAGIVTCGGLCPGLNNVIRSLYLELHHGYGAREVLGFRGGYQGLDPARGARPFVLNSEMVDDIHREGGTMLDTSRGPVDISVAVKNLIRRDVRMLFTIGGDGTQRGANAIFQEARALGHHLAVVGIPKTVDNDVPFVSRSFGYLTAVEEAAHVLSCAHTEAHSVEYGISLVRLMGRHAGFITAGATVASQDVNFTLVPEVPFKLEGKQGFLEALKHRVLKRKHALIAVAEGAGQDLLGQDGELRDASGNLKLQDIGPFLRAKIEEYFRAEGIPIILRYFDPNYIIRSVPADSEDAVLCDLYARNAVHAAMAGKTGLVVGMLHDKFIHVPIGLVVSGKKRLNPEGSLWRAVLSGTGQPARFE